MKVSLSVFSFNFFGTSNTFLEKLLQNKNINLENSTAIFTELQKHGLDGVEMGLHNNFTDEEIEKLRILFQKLKVPILSVHQPIRLLSHSDIKEVERVFVAAKKLGAKLVVLHSDMAGKQLVDSIYKNSIKRLEKKYNLVAAFENMQKHYIISPNSLYYNPEKFQSLMRKNNFAITLDTTHMGQVKGNIITFFQENKTLVRNIHISDFKPHFFCSVSPFSKYKMHMEIGKGVLPFKEFLQTLKKKITQVILLWKSPDPLLNYYIAQNLSKNTLLE